MEKLFQQNSIEGKAYKRGYCWPDPVPENCLDRNVA